MSTTDRNRADGSQAFSRTGIAILVFAAVVALSLFLTGWEDAVQSLVAVGVSGLLVLVALACAHYIVRSLRWHVLIRVAGYRVPWRVTSSQFVAGFAMTATPGRIGELVRLRWLMRTTGHHFGTLLPIAFADRAIELASMVGLIVILLALSSLGSLAVWWVAVAGAVITWIACRPGVLERVIGGLHLVSGRRWPRLAMKLRRMARRLRPFMRLPVFLPVLGLGIAGWFLEALAFWLLLSWLGAVLPLPVAGAIFLVAVLSGALTGLPGGLGGMEAACVALLLVQGVPLDTAVVATAVIRIATLWFAVLLGLIFLPFVERRGRAQN